MLTAQHSVDISVIVPAFNEAQRLGGFLDRLIAYCQQSWRTYEILIVDDGSRDETARLALAASRRAPGIWLLRLRDNRGKGYAVKRGFFAAKGRLCAFLDADGSVDPEEIERNVPYLLDGSYQVFAGSRVVRGEGQVLAVKTHRKLIGIVFNWLVQHGLFDEVKDTQCGFKMFTRKPWRPSSPGPRCGASASTSKPCIWPAGWDTGSRRGRCRGITSTARGSASSPTPGRCS